MQVDLKEIVESLECVSADVCFYLDTTSGTLIPLTEETIGELEDEAPDDDVPQWQREVRAEARLIIDNVGNRFVKLPDSFEIHEWEIMNDFCRSIEDQGTFDELAQAIRGNGAFQKFRSYLQRHGLEKRWYSHRRNALRALAIEWCKENGMQYIE